MFFCIPASVLPRWPNRCRTSLENPLAFTNPGALNWWRQVRTRFALLYLAKFPGTLCLPLCEASYLSLFAYYIIDRPWFRLSEYQGSPFLSLAVKCRRCFLQVSLPPCIDKQSPRVTPFHLACAMKLVKVTLMMYFRVSTPIRYTIIKDYSWRDKAPRHWVWELVRLVLTQNFRCSMLVNVLWKLLQVYYYN